MLTTKLIGQILRSNRPLITRSQSSNTTLNIAKLEEETELDLDINDEETRIKEELIQSKRNKSRLNPEHRNMLLGNPPYEQPMHWSHSTLKYQRKLYGKYGDQSKVNPALCWFTKQELKDKIEYENICYPYSIQELMEQAKSKKAEREERIQKRQEDIGKKILKLEAWKQELINKIEKKESEAKAAKDRKEKLIEEVRRHFGYTVDPRDDKFKELLEKKEKEQKKAIKEAKKKAKEDKMISKLTAISDKAPKQETPKEE